MYKMKLSRGILPLLLAIALLLPQSAFAAAPGIPDFDGAAATELSRNVPALPAEDIDTQEHITYSPLDALGRPGPVTACLGAASVPTGLRSDDVSTLPVGWEMVRYEDGYLYSLCHLLSPALGGDASAAENVFTGTRYLQKESMRLYEDRIADCLARTTYHVLCRVTPVYSGDNLVPTGVQMEAYSLEDGGKTVCFNVFLYNIQPGVSIDYRTGLSVQDDSIAVEFSAKDLLALRFYPEPSQMLAPLHGSFDALSEEYQKGTPAANVQTQSTYIPTTVYIPNNGDPDQKYHATDTCSGMSSPAARSFDSVKTKYEPCPKCWSEAEFRYLMSIYQGPTNNLPSAAQSGPVSAASPQPAPVNNPTPTEKPGSTGNSLLSGILSSALSTDNTMVWISYMDKCYHRSDSCPNVDTLSAYQKTLDWAKASGYTPCGECW